MPVVIKYTKDELRTETGTNAIKSGTCHFRNL